MHLAAARDAEPAALQTMLEILRSQLGLDATVPASFEFEDADAVWAFSFWVAVPVVQRRLGAATAMSLTDLQKKVDALLSSGAFLRAVEAAFIAEALGFDDATQLRAAMWAMPVEVELPPPAAAAPASGVSDGGIAGIVIGSIVLLGVGAYVLKRRRDAADVSKVASASAK